MPRKPRKASGNFTSAFDDELINVETPEDSLNPPETKTEELKKDVPTYSDQVIEAEQKSRPNPEGVLEDKELLEKVPESKFGLTLKKDMEQVETVNKTYKINDFTARKLDSLVHNDSKNTKKISGTKGFLSDFLENAIWQHFLQLGLIDEEEANKHIQDYSKYPINVENFKNLKK